MKIRRKQRETRTHAMVWVMLIAIVALSFILYQGIQGTIRVMEGWTAGLPSLENTDAFNYTQESHMYAADETTLLAEFQLEKRDPITYDQISPFVLRGTVDTEDIRFYDHTGVDLPGIARAVVNNLSGGNLEGASTITQQLVRNTLLSQEATDISFERKIREAQLAIDMEKMYSKDDILVKYLNTINYGDGCYGIEAAAQNYFQTSAYDLTLTQAATLVGIPQSPTYLNPKENPDACLARRNVVLNRMLAANDITQDEYDAAQAEELNLNPAPDAPEEGIYAYPYFTSYVRDELTKEDNQYNCSVADLFEGGLTIYTTLDPLIQDKAEAACATQDDRMADNLESSLVAIDPQTGYVKALVGGKDYYTEKWNIATQGGRPTGSSFKAFTLATAIEQGIDPNTLIDCSNPLTMTEDKLLYNFGNIDYGIRSIQSATAVSSNTGYYRLIEKVTPTAVIDMAHRLGITGQMSNYPIITLGTENATPLEMASAYATFAANGIQRDPVIITKIVDKNGTTLYEAPNTARRVLSEEVAGATTKVLRTVFESSEGTANNARLASGQPVAGKTGTGQEFRDHWLVGYTPTLSCAVWIGDRLYNSTDASLTANELWRDFMSRALEDQPIQDFPTTKDPSYTNAFNEEQQKKLNDKTDLTKAPNVVGKSLTEATSILEGYKAGYVEDYSDTVPANVIMSQTVQDDQLVLTVSQGPKPADSPLDTVSSNSPESVSGIP